MIFSKYFIENFSDFSSASNLGEFSHDVKMLAALQEDDKGRLLDAARRLAGAFSDLLDAAQPGSKEVQYKLGIKFQLLKFL